MGWNSRPTGERANAASTRPVGIGPRAAGVEIPPRQLELAAAAAFFLAAAGLLGCLSLGRLFLTRFRLSWRASSRPFWRPFPPVSSPPAALLRAPPGLTGWRAATGPTGRFHCAVNQFRRRLARQCPCTASATAANRDFFQNPHPTVVEVILMVHLILYSKTVPDARSGTPNRESP